jgi:hypothetical protein
MRDYYPKKALVIVSTVLTAVLRVRVVLQREWTREATPEVNCHNPWEKTVLSV